METRTRLGAVMLVVSTALAIIGCATTPSPTTTSPTSTLSPQPATSAPAPTALPTFGPPTSPTLAATTAALFQPAGPFPADIVEELVVEADIPYTDTVQCGGADCQVPLDALAPDGSDLPPTFVAVPGGPVDFSGRRYMAELAAATALRGAVVFLITYRSRVTGDGQDESLQDIRCAIKFARMSTINYGGDPDNVVLVGHSFGSFLALQTAVDNEAPTPGCAAEGDGVPEAVVGLSSFNASVTGDATSGPRILLVGGSLDPQSQPGAETAQNLVDAGFDAEYRELDGVTHEAMVDPSTPGVVDALFDAAIHDGAN